LLKEIDMVRKFSRKREAILAAIRSTDIHPSAEWVHARLVTDYPGLSLGTVYRNIAMFRDEGDIISVGVVNGEERFDGNTMPHAHFICNKCGRVIDIPSAGIDSQLDRAVSEACGVKVFRHELTFRGLCGDCGGEE
jgi:Fur family peroxide stress response transcriptional regulator